MLIKKYIAPVFLLLVISSCTPSNKEKETGSVPGTYGFDADFLRKHMDVIELSDPEGSSRLLLSAAYQGRVFTSSAQGESGTSFGWINYDLIASREKNKQFNAVGGEERFWLGPEGGQYSIYFAPGDPFDINHWQVPVEIDTVTYQVSRSSATEAAFEATFSLTNYSGTNFSLVVERTIKMLGKEELNDRLQVDASNVHFVGYETNNRIQNNGTSDWKKESGLLSIWLLGMFAPSDNTSVIIPFHPSKDAHAQITTNYFGEIPSERLNIRDSVLFFTCDGKYRSKLGLPPSIAKPLAGSFDSGKNILTILQFTVEKAGDYVNSKWELQKEPYKGDAVNTYNDGPLDNGGQLGPFYEIESSSSASELKPGESQVYRQMTVHFEGDFESLNNLSRQILGVDLHELK